MKLLEWKEKMMEQVEGIVFVSCVCVVPHNINTKRYQVYNHEGTYDEIFDITLDSDENIIKIV